MSSGSTAPTKHSPSSASSVADVPYVDEDTTGAVVVVHVGEREYAVPVSLTREIVRNPRIIRVPNAGPACIGIMNVRGMIVTVLDLGVMLHGVRAARAASVVLIEDGARRVGFAVDDVRDVRRLGATHEESRRHSTGLAVPTALAAKDHWGGSVIDPAELCAQYLLSAEEMGR